jgi:gamma-glutamylputrescine oxidase
MWSFWEQQSFIGKPDLTVIGSGIVGLSAAIEYATLHPKHKITVIEAGHLPSGASTKNAGFACYGSPTELLMDLENIDNDTVFSTLTKRLNGLENLKNLVGEKNIGYEDLGSYELFTKQQESTYHSTIEKLNDLNKKLKEKLGFTPYSIDNDCITKFGFNNMFGAIQIKGEGQINTGLMMTNLLALAKEKGITIINGLKVSAVTTNTEGVLISTESGDIQSNKCLIATNGFAKQFFPEIDVQPARAQVLITKPIKNLAVKGTFHFDCGYYYFRNVGDRVLFGGGRNLDKETETTTDNTLNAKIQDNLEQYLQTHILPNTPHEIEQQWTGIMGVGNSKQAIVKQVDENIYCSIRLGGMGIAIGCLIGKEAAKLLSK